MNFKLIAFVALFFASAMARPKRDLRSWIVQHNNKAMPRDVLQRLRNKDSATHPSPVYAPGEDNYAFDDLYDDGLYDEGFNTEEEANDGISEREKKEIIDELIKLREKQGDIAEDEDEFDETSEDEEFDDGLSEAEKKTILKELLKLKKEGAQKLDDGISAAEKLKILKDLIRVEKEGDVSEDEEDEEDDEDLEYDNGISEQEKKEIIDELIRLREKQSDQKSEDVTADKMNDLEDKSENQQNEEFDDGLSEAEKKTILKELLKLKKEGDVSQDGKEEKDENEEDTSEKKHLVADYIVQILRAIKDQ